MVMYKYVVSLKKTETKPEKTTAFSYNPQTSKKNEKELSSLFAVVTVFNKQARMAKTHLSA